jgi:hypothetical protein
MTQLNHAEEKINDKRRKTLPSYATHFAVRTASSDQRVSRLRVAQY